jgi:riboflavin biosynthesis pyrimidine reductase
MEPLELLFEPKELPSFDLPDELARLYPGTLGLPDDCLYANFVETLDGVVALPDVPRANRLIADESDADHLVMALLRACANVVLIGAGTLRASPASQWLPESAYPPLAAPLATVRSALGLDPQPRLAVITTGRSTLALRAEIEQRLIVLTARPNAGRIRRELPGAQVIAVAGDEGVDALAAVSALREQGHRRILYEGGPTLFASLLRASLVDELFLTLSPVLAGRALRLRDALGLVENEAFMPEARIAAKIGGIRRSGSHLFLRYLLDPA